MITSQADASHEGNDEVDHLGLQRKLYQIFVKLNKHRIG
jgi:hypothetical protein